MKPKFVLIFSVFLSFNTSTLSSESFFLKKSVTLPIALLGVYSISYVLFKALAPANGKPALMSFEPCKENMCADVNYYLFAHGLAETHKQALWYTNGFTQYPSIIDGFLFTYDYPDATNYFWRVNWMYTSLGQNNEVLCFKNNYEQAVDTLAKKDKSSQKLILFGVSRGAATVLNFVGRYQPEHVKALILEAPFDSTRSLSNNILSYVGLDKYSFAQTIGHYGISGIFWQHSVNGQHTQNYLCDINKELPILLICTKKDRVVPWQSTYNIYKILRQNGHHSVHIFIAEDGGHTRIIHGSDGKNYQCITHAFYKKYGCSYDETLAQQGEVLLQNSQPVI